MGKSLTLSSKKAITHENAITRYSGQLVETPDCCRRRWPYQANVINTLLKMSNRIVYIPFVIPIIIYGCKVTTFFLMINV